MQRKDSKGRILKSGEYEKYNGYYLYRYKLINGKYKELYAKSLNELRKKEEELEKQKTKYGNFKEPVKTTLTQVFDLWQTNKTYVKKNTLGNYIYVYKHYIKDELGDIPIVNFKKSDILIFYNGLIGKKKAKISTLDNINNVLYQLFEFARDDDIIIANPCDNVYKKVKKQVGDRKKRQSLTHKQEKVFMEYTKKHKEYESWYNIFTILLGTGMRVGELTGLLWQNVNFKKEEIYIKYNYIPFDRYEGVSKGYLSTPKTEASIRTIPMLKAVKETLIKIKNQQEKANLKCKIIVDGKQDFVFLNRYCCPLHYASINRAIKRIVSRYNDEELKRATKNNVEGFYLPDFSSHIFRHTFATRMCENENNLKVIQEIMGHASIETTMDIYAQATKESKEKTVNKLNEAMFEYNV